MLRKSFAGLLLGGLVLLVAMLPFLGDWLVVRDLAAPADAIVVIGGDHKPERVRRAVELYRQGCAPVVIISAGTRVREGGDLLPEAEVMRGQALSLGLPEEAIVLEERSRTTAENARYTLQICRERGLRSILLVTSAYHSRRARRIFRDVCAPDIRVLVQPAPAGSDPALWWLHADEARVVLYEVVNWVGYWVQQVGG